MFEKFRDPKFLEEYKTSKKYEKIRNQYLDYYNKVNIEPMPITFSRLRMFSEVGERYQFEEAYNQHFDRLVACAYMAIIYGDDKYVREVDDCLYDVLSVYCWALSAHIPDLSEENYYELDLGSCAHAVTLSIIYNLLGEKIHPQLKKRIKTELRRRILEPFKAQIWHWEDRYNNWTSVCAGFVGIALMLMFPEEFDALYERFELNMKKYYLGFPDDGVCLEGPGYWGYGFVSFLAYALALKDYTGGRVDYFKLEKTKKIAFYYQNTVLYKDVITSYGDCPMDVKTNAALFHILKSQYGSEFYMPTEVRHSLPTNPLIHPLLYIEYYNPENLEDSLPLGECYMENAGMFIARTPKYAFGAKGGTNGESHNHNDVGSFVFAKDNEQILIDMGGRPYTKDYFTDKRYDYLEPSSRGHNVPIINDKYQLPGGTRTSTEYKDGCFSVEFASVYHQSELKSLTRTFSPDENGITISDKVSFDGDLCLKERLVTFIEPKISEGEIFLGDTRITFGPELAKASYETETHVLSTNENGETKDGKTVYLITLEVTDGADSFEFRIEA